MISDKEKEEIRQEARALLESFATKLEKVNLSEKKIKKIKENSGMREEGKGEEANSDFKKRFLDNAPNTDEDNIIAEKKSW